jgi:hypothetical protein
MFGREKKLNGVSPIDNGCLVCNGQGQVYEASRSPGDRMSACPACSVKEEEKVMDIVEPQEITQGQYLVGLDFNPGGLESVNDFKRGTAEIMDRLHEFMMLQMDEGGNDAAGRCAAVALSKYEEACMWAVKAVTKPPMPE